MNKKIFSDLRCGDYFYAVIFNKVIPLKIESDCNWDPNFDEGSLDIKNHLLYHIDNNEKRDLSSVSIKTNNINETTVDDYVFIRYNDGNWPCKIFADKDEATKYSIMRTKHVIINEINKIVSVGDLLPLYDTINHKIRYVEVYDAKHNYEMEKDVMRGKLIVTVLNTHGELQGFENYDDELEVNKPFNMLTKSYKDEDLDYNLYLDNEYAVKTCISDIDCDIYNLTNQKSNMFTFLYGKRSNL